MRDTLLSYQVDYQNKEVLYKMNNTKIAVVGGDLRLVFAAKALAKSGFSVSLFGIDTHEVSTDELFTADSLEIALENVWSFNFILA